MSRPILYSFRRCPYAMRARLAIARSGKKVELREILLRDKAPEFLEASPKGTVPVLVLDDGQVIEESLDVMDWALDNEIPPQQLQLIHRSDEEFKPWLDRYKYPARYEDGNADDAFAKAALFLMELNERLAGQPFLFGAERSVADIGIAPFVRQFAHVNLERFKAQDWKNLISWYEEFVDWPDFRSIMEKYPKWESGDETTIFP